MTLAGESDAVVPCYTVSQKLALELLENALTKAAAEGVPSAVAVVDVAGELKAFCRMDGAPLLSVSIAQDKAYTAAAYGIQTDQWHDFIKDDAPLLHGIVHRPRLVVFGGGYPLLVGGAVVGGIGVSGGHYHQDMTIARFAMASAGIDVA